MATLAKLLQVDMGLPDMAKRLAAAGRGKDTILAHINPKEAKLLKSRGGSGKINPKTGIMEFDDYAEDPNAGEAEATQYQQENPAPQDSVPPDQSMAETQRLASAGTPAAPVPPGAPAYAPSQLPATEAPSPQLAADFMKQTTEQPGVFGQVKQGAQAVSGGYNELAKALGVTPEALGKFGVGAFGAVQGNKAANQVRAETGANENEIRSLAQPYREQGQKLLQMGQSGQLTAPQQQKLEAIRAQVMQQQAGAGIQGGTAGMQAEAVLARTAQQFAQENIDQGMKLMSLADQYIQDAIRTGYQGSKDAAALTRDFYSALGFGVPKSQAAPAG
jgi:hypothetical protein